MFCCFKKVIVNIIKKEKEVQKKPEFLTLCSLVSCWKLNDSIKPTLLWKACQST